MQIKKYPIKISERPLLHVEFPIQNKIIATEDLNILFETHLYFLICSCFVRFMSTDKLLNHFFCLIPYANYIPSQRWKVAVQT